MSALPIADDEGRPMEELLALPGNELGAILRVRPATVLTAGPGGPQVNEVGDGTLSAPAQGDPGGGPAGLSRSHDMTQRRPSASTKLVVAYIRSSRLNSPHVRGVKRCPS